MRLTAKQAAERLNLSYVVASGLMSHLEDVGKAKIVEKVFHASGKCKPTRVYEVESNVVISFGEDILQPSVVEDAVAPVDVVSEDTALVEVVTEEIVTMTVAESNTVEETVDSAPETISEEPSYYYDDEDEDDAIAA